MVVMARAPSRSISEILQNDKVVVCSFAPTASKNSQSPGVCCWSHTPPRLVGHWLIPAAASAPPRDPTNGKACEGAFGATGRRGGSPSNGPPGVDGSKPARVAIIASPLPGRPANWEELPGIMVTAGVDLVLTPPIWRHKVKEILERAGWSQNGAPNDFKFRERKSRPVLSRIPALSLLACESFHLRRTPLSLSLCVSLSSLDLSFFCAVTLQGVWFSVR